MTVLGFDSRYTTTIPSNTEYEFAGIKISQAVGGGPYSQPLVQWERAGELGLDRLPFHFWSDSGDSPEDDGQEQANWFYRIYKDNFLGMGAAELPPVIDCEDIYSSGGLWAVRNILACLKRTEELWGRRPMIYSAGWWWDRKIKPYTSPGHELYTYDLWEADPPPDTPIGHWLSSESRIVQVRLDFAKAGFNASIDENEAQDEWYAEQTTQPDEPNVHTVHVPRDADIIRVVRDG